MFYLLIISSLSLIILGLFNNKNKDFNLNSIFTKTANHNESNTANELNELKYRVENLENILFYDNEKEENVENEPSNSLKIYKLLCQYEKENYTIEEISQILEVKKGELLLLKNLYKNYSV